MKANKQTKPSRREFLKKSGQAAITSGLAAAIGGCATDPNSTRKAGGAKAQAVTRTARQRDNAKTKKLGELADQPKGSAFKQLDQRRMPGWRPDTADDFWGTEEYYFEEEAIAKRKDDGKYVYFPTPKLRDYNDFNEPGTKDDQGHIVVPDTLQNRVAFNSWILGGSLDSNSKEPFDILLNHIANAVRRYNAALYWLRRLHFAQTSPKDSPAPPQNPHGPPDEKNNYVPKPDDEQFANKVKVAEDEWKKQVDKLNKILSGEDVPTPDPKLPYILADMIEVNGYIVSMRVIAQDKDFANLRGEAGIVEVPGSSSSHTSISSAFSSPNDGGK